MFKTVSEKVLGTRFRWDRNWKYYRVVAVLSEEKTPEEWPCVEETEIEKYKSDIASGWSGYIIELKTPISVLPTVRNVIVGNDFIIYPPFELNKKDSKTGLLNDVNIPKCKHNTTISINIPEYTTKGVHTEVVFAESKPYYGLRIDCRDNVEIDLPL